MTTRDVRFDQVSAEVHSTAPQNTREPESPRTLADTELLEQRQARRRKRLSERLNAF